ncbi:MULTISPECIES: glycosyltransferase family 39 protein [unclassified Lentimonas]|uniref:glycosyltransferase family 39 protein n=1 Tax=unclassified Lentimonas TaxID=2630993 RepID=UPI001328FCFA|nr:MULTISPECIES: glycosyltransferase family 39 protein [unclassified Lentimonas]CAA6676525.1 Unannotated [Lentimonas sp. CC4]CAA6685365.1 Unannotated [Lentimonas sp. CC6]CAA7074911.1 Unannotated [Lentimonas sp. CC4]CAA7169536.1 Unannotated [Lentimonas sp. CC21]CAA7182701.1 Unannotated [Lentimonas sp. CC8]
MCRTPVIRLIALCVCAAGAAAMLVWGVETTTAIWLVKHCGYWLMLGTFVGLVASLVVCFKESKACDVSSLVRRLCVPGLFIVVASLILISMQPREYKIVMDEPVLAATSLQMHHHNQVLTVSKAYEINGIFDLLGGYVDKRPYFYPFLVSLLHDIVGYDSMNGVLLNGLLVPVFFILLYALGAMVWPKWGGYFSCLLFLTVPLLAMVVASGGFDFLNLVMLVATVLAALVYSRAPSFARMNLLILLAVLLAQTRYESSLYVCAVALVFVASWIRSRGVFLSRLSIVAPLLMLPVALLRETFHEGLWQLNAETGEDPFALSFFGDNLGHAWRFFFSMNDTIPGSMIVSVCFVGSVALLLCYSCVRPAAVRRQFDWLLSSHLGYFILIAVVNFLLLMCYYWGQLDDIVASRIALPYVFFQIVLTVVAARLIVAESRGGAYLLLLPACLFVSYTWPLCARSNFLKHATPQGAAWLREKVRSSASENPLFVTSSHLIPIAEQVSGTIPKFVLAHPDRIELHDRLRTFSDIYFVYTNVETLGEDEVLLEPLLNDRFELEVIDSESLVDGVEIRMARLLEVRLEDIPRISLDVDDDEAQGLNQAFTVYAKALP